MIRGSGRVEERKNGGAEDPDRSLPPLLHSSAPPLAAIPAVSVVLPVYRNRATAAELAERLGRALAGAGLSHELIFVVDGCPERSEEVLLEVARGRPEVGVLRLACNAGQNRAALMGLAEAAGEVCVVMDADLQDPPEAVPALVAAYRPGLGAVFARRPGARHRGPRQWSSALFKTSLWLFSAGRIPRQAGLFVLIGPPLREFLLRRCIEPEPYVLAQIARSGVRTTSVAVERRPAPGDRSSYTPGMRLALAARGLRQLLLPARVARHRPPRGRPPWTAAVEWRRAPAGRSDGAA